MALNLLFSGTMKEDQKSSDTIYDQTIHGVCSWCHWLYAKTSGKRIKWLDFYEYSEIQSHGICEVCKERELGCLE